jgi:hypothetical protein
LLDNPPYSSTFNAPLSIYGAKIVAFVSGFKRGGREGYADTANPDNVDRNGEGYGPVDCSPNNVESLVAGYVDKKPRMLSPQYPSRADKDVEFKRGSPVGYRGRSITYTPPSLGSHRATSSTIDASTYPPSRSSNAATPSGRDTDETPRTSTRDERKALDETEEEPFNPEEADTYSTKVGKLDACRSSRSRDTNVSFGSQWYMRILAPPG